MQEVAKVLSLKGKVALITGASWGIGAATSALFAKIGAKVALSGRNLDKLKVTAEQCDDGQNGKAFIVPGDITDEAVARNIVHDTVAHFGQLDVLVNNAGIFEFGSVENATLKQFDRIMNTNVRAVFYLTHLAVPHIIRSKGNIVNVSSLAGLRTLPGFLAYCMSKSAMNQFTRGAALELASKQVRVNAVCPGVIVTGIHLRAGMGREEYAKFLEECKRAHALGRPGTSDEVAQAIAFLASDAASFITGVTLPVDGGRHAMVPECERHS
ncbi:3-oxoacyl-[acyl-carrier-protein] reductase FabG-like [Protopterus annectens]|uniref:3-oxoacyl-[acyl-carrier-protein] reductase FabG-like n=1 Tax=Protopterus annectens TaxID=7888 RepID=UPI001CFA7158|nr:3-oxoacyl-[acyl-carrier-protein] reductase FabG-like [Protopterus annectens]